MSQQQHKKCDRNTKLKRRVKCRANCQYRLFMGAVDGNFCFIVLVSFFLLLLSLYWDCSVAVVVYDCHFEFMVRV